ncbi:MAG: cytochrome c oxidase subunit II [Burkholderiales bacterium]
MFTVQDMLSAAGPQARHIEALWWLMLAVCSVVFVAVLAALAWVLWRAPRAAAGTPPDLRSLAQREGGTALAVALAVLVSGLLLIGLMVASFATDRGLGRLGPPELEIEVTAHRWWWEARYTSTEPSNTFVTANELHIPVGKPVLLRLRSDDVIHSLWVPALAGKKDLIPGREATLEVQADKPGTYRGQCAEFCGAQHAKMAFVVIADDEYENWAAAQRKPAREPSNADQERGRNIFLAGTCVMCHAIQGTSANARRAPDLTHLASRGTLAAGTVPNTVGHLAGWILDPQGIKPGVNMPANPMAPDDLQALLAYLTGLQ